jgi:hypothetical protein
MTVLGNWVEDHVKILAYSVNRARTEGNGVEGSLVHVKYTLADGASLPENISFHFSVINVPGTSLNPELLNVVCSYPDEQNPVSVSTALASADNNLLISPNLELSQNYPNPFNPVTTINYSIPKLSDVQVIVYDITGRKVITLVEATQKPGHYTIQWNAHDAASGLYFLKLESNRKTQTRKIMLLK